MKTTFVGAVILLLLCCVFCQRECYAGTAVITKPATTYIYGGGITNSSSYYQSGGERLTNGTICIYRFFLPPPIVGSQSISSIQVWVYGKATGSSGGLTTLWIGTDPNDHSTSVSNSAGLYLAGNYTGSAAQNLVAPAGDGIGSALDLTLEVLGSGKEYDLNYIQVACTYSNVDNAVLTYFLDAYAGYRTLSNYASWHSAHWGLTNYAQSSFQDGIRWGCSQIPDWQNIAAEIINSAPYTAVVELQSFGSLSQIANLLTVPIDEVEFQPAYASDYYSLWHPESSDPSVMVNTCNAAATNLMNLAYAWTNAFNGTLSLTQQSMITQDVNSASNSVFSVLVLFNHIATSLSDVYLKAPPGSSNGDEEARVLFNVLSLLMRYDYSTNVPWYQTPPLDANSFLPKILQAIAGQTIPYYLTESNGMAAYYPLDGSALDASGNGHNGTVFGSPATVNGAVGSALQFNTTNDYISISNFAFQNANQRSLTLWVKPAPSPLKVMDFLSKHNDGTDCAVLIRTQSDGKYDAEWTIGGVFYDLASGIPGQGSTTGLVTPAYSTFDFLALVYDGNEISFYVNGNLIKQMTATGNIATNANPLLIGRYLDNLSENVIGTLDEIRIYDRALSSSDVRQLYTQAAFAYTNNNGSITITGYNGSGGALTIPSTINGLAVTSIGDYAFQGHTNLSSIIIPNSVTNIGVATFAGCTSLSSLAIPNGVSSIGASAFNGCTNLTNIAIPNSITSIPARAFWHCFSLSSISIPNSVTNIGSSAFAVCSSLTSIFFESSAPSADSTVFGNDANATVYYLPGSTGWGSTFGGVPAVLWNPQPQTADGSFGVRSNHFGFNIDGTANIPIAVEATTNLNGATWVPLLIGTLTNGSLYFSDPTWTNYPTRFYRISSQ